MTNDVIEALVVPTWLKAAIRNHSVKDSYCKKVFKSQERGNSDFESWPIS